VLEERYSFYLFPNNFSTTPYQILDVAFYLKYSEPIFHSSLVRFCWSDNVRMNIMKWCRFVVALEGETEEDIMTSFRVAAAVVQTLCVLSHLATLPARSLQIHCFCLRTWGTEVNDLCIYIQGYSKWFIQFQMTIYLKFTNTEWLVIHQPKEKLSKFCLSHYKCSMWLPLVTRATSRRY
jgi:hypothetical protein